MIQLSLEILQKAPIKHSLPSKPMTQMFSHPNADRALQFLKAVNFTISKCFILPSCVSKVKYPYLSCITQNRDAEYSNFKGSKEFPESQTWFDLSLSSPLYLTPSLT